MITSVQNPMVRHLVKLREERKYRRKNQSALIMGNKLVKEVCATLNPLVALLLEGTKLPKGMERCPHFFVTQEVLKKVTALPSPEPLCAEIPLPSPTPLNSKKRILALDAIRDPGNLGTLARTALALGWEGLFLLPQTVDPFHEKAIRSSKGALFRFPYFEGSLDQLKTLVKDKSYDLYLADLSGTSIEKVQPKEKTILILGSESHGPSAETKKLGKRITIPMKKEMESLNVAIAGGILLYELGPKI